MLSGMLGYTQPESNVTLQTSLFRRNCHGKYLSHIAWRRDALC
jgi:hypothetical protein